MMQFNRIGRYVRQTGREIKSIIGCTGNNINCVASLTSRSIHTHISRNSVLNNLYLREPHTSKVVTDIPGSQTKEYLSKLNRYQDTRTCQLVMDSRKSFGNYLIDIDGNTFLDFHSMIASIPIGYNNPVFSEKLDHRTLLDTVNRPALGVFPPQYLLPGVEKIMSKAPPGLNKLFLSMSGSDANEIAFKMAFMKYQHSQRDGNDFTEHELSTSLVNDEPGSPNLCILSFDKGFHGRLLGTLSTTHSKPIHKVDIPSFKWPIAPFPKLTYPLNNVDNAKINRKEEDRCLQIIEQIIKTNNVPVAGLIIEPVQAEGGDNYATPYFFQRLRDITKNNSVTFIVDEVQTGVGGTGRFWAHQHWDLPESPDIVTFAKKMQVAGMYYKDSYVASHPFRNFNTWMGNPLDILKAGIVIDYIDDNNLIDKVNLIGHDFVATLKHFKDIYNVRGGGAFIAFDMESTELRDRLINKMKEEGVIINGCGERTVRLRPMLIYNYDHIDEFLFKLDNAIKSIFR